MNEKKPDLKRVRAVGDERTPLSHPKKDKVRGIEEYEARKRKGKTSTTELTGAKEDT